MAAESNGTTESEPTLSGEEMKVGKRIYNMGNHNIELTLMRLLKDDYYLQEKKTIIYLMNSDGVEIATIYKNGMWTGKLRVE